MTLEVSRANLRVYQTAGDWMGGIIPFVKLSVAFGPTNSKCGRQRKSLESVTKITVRPWCQTLDMRTERMGGGEWFINTVSIYIHGSLFKIHQHLLYLYRQSLKKGTPVSKACGMVLL